MTNTEFIKAELKKISNKLSFLRIRYEYLIQFSTHLIEIKPQDTFENNEEYIFLEEQLEIKFQHKYPYEEIIFISENSLTCIEKPIFKYGYSKIPEYTAADLNVNCGLPLGRTTSKIETTEKTKVTEVIEQTTPVGTEKKYALAA